MKQREGERLLIGVYAIISCTNSKVIKDFNKEMMKLVKMTNLGLLFSNLGIQVI